MKFLDLFAGIGGFRLGMEANNHECVGYVEWDKYARKSYEAIHDTKGEWTAHDITAVTDGEWAQFRETVDIICGGFPCQAFSVAGKRGGFEDTRGTLFFEIARAAEQIKPRYLFLENVKGLLSHDKGNTFGTILHTLDELGYDCEWQVCNSKNFGVPQNRERVFIIGHLRGTGRREIFPIGGINESTDSSIIKVGNIRKNGKSQSGNVFDANGIAPTLCSAELQKDPLKIIRPVLTPDRIEKRQNGRRFKEDGEPMFTLTAQDKHGVAILKSTRTEYGKEIRKAYESGEIQESRHNMTKLEPRQDGISNTITTVQKDNLLIEGLPIKEATKQGYSIAKEGDSINLAVPNSQTRRGRVGKGVANTLDTSCNQGVLIPDNRMSELLESLPNEKKVVGTVGHHPFSKKQEFNGYHGEVSPCLVATDYKAPKTTLTNEYRIRKLTPRECWRLQGFPDWAFDKAQEVNSNSQLYKQAGNSVTVNVIAAIASHLK